MNKYKERELDAFLKKATQSMELERAPKNFSIAVMQQLNVKLVNKSNIAYEPLVSTKGWIAILLLVSSFIGFLIFGEHQVKMDWFTTLKLNTLGNMNLLERVANTLFVSDSTIYALVGLLVFMGVQVWYLKRFFAKRQVLL